MENNLPEELRHKLPHTVTLARGGRVRGADGPLAPLSASNQNLGTAPGASDGSRVVVK